MLIYLINLLIILELAILYYLHEIANKTSNIKWCEFDSTYVDKMIDIIENVNKTKT